MKLNRKKSGTKNLAAVCAVLVLCGSLAGCGFLEKTGPKNPETSFHETMRQRGFTENQIQNLLDQGYSQRAILHMTR